MWRQGEWRCRQIDKSEGLWRRLLSSGQKVALCWCQIPIWYKEDIQARVCVCVCASQL